MKKRRGAKDERLGCTLDRSDKKTDAGTTFIFPSRRCFPGVVLSV